MNYGHSRSDVRAKEARHSVRASVRSVYNSPVSSLRELLFQRWQL
jgi:hypothetical protein